MSETTKLIAQFTRARHDPELAVLGGFHAVKHALRFHAELIRIVTSDIEILPALFDTLAPDVKSSFFERIEIVDPELFRRLTPHVPYVPVIAIGRRRDYMATDILSDDTGRRIVFLEDPRNLGNVGAVIRAAAGADTAGVLLSGRLDPWAPMVIQGAAGLQYALPVAKVGELPGTSRPVVAVHPEGDDLATVKLPKGAILAFGTERHGLSDSLLDRATLRVRIPMKEGVSSLNLATSVAILLYTA